MKKVLITGGNGLIGKEFLRKAREIYEVYSVVRRIPDSPVKDVEYIICDLSIDWNISHFPKKVDSIVHFAQSQKFREFPEAAEDIFNVNTLSTAKLLDYGKRVGVSSFIYASSGGVYGGGEKHFLEDEPIVANRNLGFYAGTKLCSEILVNNYANIFKTVIQRIFFAYGEEQKRSMLIPRLVDNVKSEKRIKLQGSNGIAINPIHVSDVALATVSAIELGVSGTYNIAGNEVVSLREIVEKISDLTGISPLLEFDNSSLPNNLIGDSTKMVMNLHRPKIGISAGLKGLI